MDRTRLRSLADGRFALAQAPQRLEAQTPSSDIAFSPEWWLPDGVHGFARTLAQGRPLQD